MGRGREHVLPPRVLEALVRDHGLDGIEVDHQDHDSDTRRRLRTLADRLGLLATGSSDYHGTGKLDHDLGCNTTDPTIFNEMQRRLAHAARKLSEITGAGSAGPDRLGVVIGRPPRQLGIELVKLNGGWPSPSSASS